MSEFRSGDAQAVVQAGMSTAIAVILSMIGLYMPVLSMIAFLLIPLPIAYLGMRQGVRWSIIVTCGVIILDAAFFGVLSAASVGSMFGILGVVIGACYQYRVSAVKTLAAGSLSVLLSMLFQGLLMSWVMGFQLSHIGGNAMAAVQQVSDELLPQYYSGDMLVQARAELKELAANMLRALPFSLIMGAVFYGWAAMFLSRKVFLRLGMKDIDAFPPVERWEMPRAVIYIYMAGLIMKYFGEAGTLLGDAGYNLVLLGMFAFWLQGIGVLWWLPHRWPVIRPVRWLVVIFGIIAPIFQMILFFAGLLDMAFNYRRRRGYQ